MFVPSHHLKGPVSPVLLYIPFPLRNNLFTARKDKVHENKENYRDINFLEH
jgi:hypothetical protein